MSFHYKGNFKRNVGRDASPHKAHIFECSHRDDMLKFIALCSDCVCEVKSVFSYHSKGMLDLWCIVYVGPKQIDMEVKC